MKNYIEAEKQPLGTQIYLNDKPFLWFDYDKAGEARKTVAEYAEKFQAEIERTTAKISSRHYKLDWNNCTLEELKHFFRGLCGVIVSGDYFRPGIGELYLSVRGIETDREEIKTVEDILHDFRRKIVIVKNLSRRPNPQKRWHGEWIDLKKLVEADRADGR